MCLSTSFSHVILSVALGESSIGRLISGPTVVGVSSWAGDPPGHDQKGVAIRLCSGP